MANSKLNSVKLQRGYRQRYGRLRFCRTGFKAVSPVRSAEELKLRCMYLCSQHSLLHSREVSVRPGTRGPRRHCPKVSGEVEPLQLVVHVVADVPGEVVVSGT